MEFNLCKLRKKKMAFVEVFCLGCGIDISSANGNCLLQTEGSHLIAPLWSHLCSKELENRGLFHEELMILGLVYKHNGKCAENVLTLSPDLMCQFNKEIELGMALWLYSMKNSLCFTFPFI